MVIPNDFVLEVLWYFVTESYGEESAESTITMNERALARIFLAVDKLSSLHIMSS